MKNIEELKGKIWNSDTVEFMNNMEEGSIDLMFTSPPYGVGIDYDSWDALFYLSKFIYPLV